MKTPHPIAVIFILIEPLEPVSFPPSDHQVAAWAHGPEPSFSRCSPPRVRDGRLWGTITTKSYLLSSHHMRCMGSPGQTLCKDVRRRGSPPAGPGRNVGSGRSEGPPGGSGSSLGRKDSGGAGRKALEARAPTLREGAPHHTAWPPGSAHQSRPLCPGAQFGLSVGTGNPREASTPWLLSASPDRTSSTPQVTSPLKLQ